MNKQIIISKETKDRMLKDFGTTSVTLWAALTFKTNSSRAKMLRGVALENGGVIHCEGYNPNYYQKTEKSGVIIQHFGDAAKITIDPQNGETVLFINGVKKSGFFNLSAVELVNLQSEAYKQHLKQLGI